MLRPGLLIGVILPVMLSAACGRAPVLAPVGRDVELDSQTRLSSPVDPIVHTVRRDETLYAIAFKYGLDYKKVASWNAIRAPYVIYPGQDVRVVQPPRLPAQKKSSTPKANSKASSKSASASSTKGVAEVSQSQAARADKAVKKTQTNVAIKGWRWPTRGNTVTSFRQSNKKGIDISGKLGQPVNAAADGKVVYSGGGLIGYGELIIIKHNKHYLSAYGHNDKLLVKQGDRVVSGQHIANMGHRGTKGVMLHFEIRRDGKPVDPIRFLPK